MNKQEALWRPPTFCAHYLTGTKCVTTFLILLLFERNRNQYMLQRELPNRRGMEDGACVWTKAKGKGVGVLSPFLATRGAWCPLSGIANGMQLHQVASIGVGGNKLNFTLVKIIRNGVSIHTKLKNH